MKEKLLRRLRILKRALTNYQYHKWILHNGDVDLLLNHNINEESIFFELGGFDGTYSSQILEKYSPISYIFEPSKKYYNLLKNNLKGEKIVIINKGLSDFEGDTYLVNTGDESFITSEHHKESQKIEVIKISEYISANNIPKIDLLNMNVEGSEYEILEDLISSGKINDIYHLQIQFHKNRKNFRKLRKNIQRKLSNTHRQVWNYDFIWEKWEKL
jgi:FkbM family methyltransferase